MDPRGPDGGGSIRTLVVGDAEGAARTAARLERADDRLDPVTAAGAAAALDALSADVECVVSAHDLPDSDGVALLEAVRESHPDLPFVLRVREDDRAVARAAAAGGVTEYIPRDDGDDGCALLADRIVAAVRRRRAGRSASVRRRARAVDAAPVGVLITDFGREDNPIVYANDRFEEMTGYAVAEARGRNCRFLQGEGTDPDAVAELRAAIEAREPATVELRNYRADGSEFWNRVSIAPLRDDDGTVTHWVGFQQDVTAARERERELRTQRAFLDQCLDAIEDVFYVFDTDRRIVQWNDRLGEVTGYSDGEIAEMGPADFFPEDHAGRVADAVREVFETGSATVRADYLTADGERIPYEFTGTRLTGPDGEVLGFAGTGRDLTERIEYERRLERQNERLEEFASVVSHDLRNPLNVAQGRLELARAERDSDHLRAVADAHERMEQLVGELLTLAREGDVVTDLRAVSLADAAADGWRTVETGGSTLSTGTDAVVRADESRLRQLFENLFRNSVEHGSTGSRPPADDSVEHGSTGNRTESGDSVEHGSTGSRPPADGDGADGGGVNVEVGLLPDGAGFYVADDGPGVPESERERVFESGYSTDDDGIGAGLSIVKRVADAHGWTVRLADAEGGGARFEIRGVDVVRSGENGSGGG